jgi:hypothetical protein
MKLWSLAHRDGSQTWSRRDFFVCVLPALYPTRIVPVVFKILTFKSDLIFLKTVQQSLTNKDGMDPLTCLLCHTYLSLSQTCSKMFWTGDILCFRNLHWLVLIPYIFLYNCFVWYDLGHTINLVAPKLWNGPSFPMHRCVLVGSMTRF